MRISSAVEGYVNAGDRDGPLLFFVLDDGCLICQPPDSTVLVLGECGAHGSCNACCSVCCRMLLYVAVLQCVLRYVAVCILGELCDAPCVAACVAVRVAVRVTVRVAVRVAVCVLVLDNGCLFCQPPNPTVLENWRGAL